VNLRRATARGTERWRPARSSGRVGDLPATARPRRSGSGVGTRASLKKYLVELRLAGQLRSALTSTPGWSMSSTSKSARRAWASGGQGRCGRAAGPIGAVRERGPHLLPVTTHSSPSRTARVPRRGEVAAGAGLAEQLAPRLPRRSIAAAATAAAALARRRPAALARPCRGR